jgi:hypothetical protein
VVLVREDFSQKYASMIDVYYTIIWTVNLFRRLVLRETCRTC